MFYFNQKRNGRFSPDIFEKTKPAFAGFFLYALYIENITWKKQIPLPSLLFFAEQ